jgi:Mg2+/Co2+ transporter CorB
VDDVMTPRKQIEALDIDAPTPKVALREQVATPITAAWPVYKGPAGQHHRHHRASCGGC